MTVTFHAEMACGGCSGAITRILKKVEGVTEVTCDLDAQTVIVDGDFDKDEAFAKLQKWADKAAKKVYVKE